MNFIRHGLLCIFIFTTTPSHSSTKNDSILIVNQANKTFSKNLTKDIKNKLAKKHPGIIIHTKNISSQPDLKDISQYSLIVTIGNKPAEYTLKKKVKKPIISVLITNQAIRAIRKKHDFNKPWVTISIDQPISRQFSLIKNLLGKESSIGILLGPVSKNLKDEITKSAQRTGMTTVSESIQITDQLISSLKSITSKSSVILAVPDPVTFNKKTIRGILLLTYRKEIPVIGFSNSYVKAGSLAAVHSTPEQISQHAYEVIDLYINEKKLKSKNIHPKYFSTSINNKVAKTLNINILNNKKLISLIKKDELSK